MRFLVVALLVFAWLAPTASAQGIEPSNGPANAVAEAVRQALDAESLPAPLGRGNGAPILGEQRMSTAVEIAVLLTVLSVLPAVLITITSFTRIIIVLSFVRRALSTNELPPNPVIIGLALFLTTFVMAPTIERVHEKAWVPYRAGQMDLENAGGAAWAELSTFLIANTRKSELSLFAELAKVDLSQSEGEAPPFRVVVPAFILSELKTAFQMGFLLFLPFLVIDLVVSSILLSMGMFMLPPVMISTPLKILLFVLVDGWHLVCESLVTSFKVAA
ncbi:MAG: flagellar type III secretion system pore protein FliP [Planctomycetes bacterium]|nr:flagellar type III secretion system pore protein FliP [Planctomycetota bacterium]